MRGAIWIAAICSSLLSTGALCAVSLSGLGGASEPVIAKSFANTEVIAWAVFTIAAALSGVTLRRRKPPQGDDNTGISAR